MGKQNRHYGVQRMYDYIEDHPELALDVHVAMHNNHCGFGYLPLDSSWIHLDTEQPYVHIPAILDDDEDCDVAFGTNVDELKAIIDKVGLAHMRFYLEQLGPDYVIQSIALEDGDDAYAVEHEFMLKQFIEFAGITSRAKLQQILEEGTELFTLREEYGCY